MVDCRVDEPAAAVSHRCTDGRLAALRQAFGRSLRDSFGSLFGRPRTLVRATRNAARDAATRRATLQDQRSALTVEAQHTFAPKDVAAHGLAQGRLHGNPESGVDLEAARQRLPAEPHLVTMYLTCYLGYLSALCGVAIKAGTGAACGLTYLMGGETKEIERAVKIVAASLTGMICDGAKAGCTLKVSTAADMALRAANMAMHEAEVPSDNGIVGGTADEITGRWVNSFSTGTAEISQVLRVAVSNVRIPRSQRMTLELPCAVMYSADISSSRIVELMPRFNSTGRGARPSALSKASLHVARAHLHNVGVLGDQGYIVFTHDLSDDGEPGRRARLGQQLQAFQFHALKIVGGSARLEGAAAQNLSAHRSHKLRRGAHDLTLAFYRAQPRHHHEPVAAQWKSR